MKLIIANCTNQNQIINTPMIEGRKAIVQTIGIGQYSLIGGSELSPPQVASIIEHMRIYGLLAADEIDTLARVPDQIPLVAFVDRTVDVRTIQRVTNHNRGVLRLLGKKLREEAAVATSLGMEAMSPHASRSLAMSVQEYSPGTMPADGDPLSEGVKMTDQPASV